MKNRSQIIFISFFLLIITSVGTIQAVFEIKKGESIQFFDVFTDTFITPFVRARRISELYARMEKNYEELTRKIDSARTTDQDMYAVDADLTAEELIYSINDIQKEFTTVNRYVNETTPEQKDQYFGALKKRAETVFDFIKNEGDVSKIDTMLRNCAKKMEESEEFRPKITPLQMPLVSMNTFFRHTAFNRSYLRSYEKALEDNSIVANTLRKPMRFFRYRLLRDAGEKVILGKDGWYFYKPGVDYLIRPDVYDKRTREVDYNDIALKDDPVSTIGKFRDQLKAMDIELLVVIVPGKPTVYPDKINDALTPRHAGRISHTPGILKKLQDKNIQVVDLFSPFHEERQKDHVYEERMYLKMDTHWKLRGLRVAAKTVANKVKQYSWYGDIRGSAQYVIDTVEVARTGDISAMTVFPDFSFRDFQVAAPTENTVCAQVYSVKRDTLGNVIDKKVFRDDYHKSKILILGDSFSRIYQTDAPGSAGWISHLAYELEAPLASIVSDGGASTLVRQKLSRKKRVLKGKKLVIWEFVERDLRYGAEGWKDVTF